MRGMSSSRAHNPQWIARLTITTTREPTTHLGYPPNGLALRRGRRDRGPHSRETERTGTTCPFTVIAPPYWAAGINLTCALSTHSWSESLAMRYFVSVPFDMSATAYQPDSSALGLAV